MKITIVSKGPWIVEMYDEVGKLCKEDADDSAGHVQRGHKQRQRTEQHTGDKSQIGPAHLTLRPQRFPTDAEEGRDS